MPKVHIRKGIFMDRFDVTNRIKNYRNLLNIPQNQLANDKLSLSLIKSIEAGRRKLTPLKANIMVENFKKIALSKGISLTIDVSEFLMSDKDYARHYCIKKLDILCNSYDEQEYEDLLNIANEYGLEDVKLNIYIKLGEHYFITQNYNTSLDFHKKAYELSIKINDTKSFLTMLVRISSCYLYLDDMPNCVFYLNRCYNSFLEKNIHDSSIESRLFYNFAAYYKRLGNYETALKWIEKAISLNNLSEQTLYHNMLFKGSILLNIGRYEDALNIYEYLLEHDTRFIHIIYHNMAYAYEKLKIEDKSVKLLNHSINIQLASGESSVSVSLMDLGDIYYKKKMYRESIVFYQYAIDSCLKYNQPIYLFTCYNMLLNLYRLSNKALNFQDHAIKLIKIYLKNPELHDKFSCFLYIVVKYLLQTNTN